MIQNPESSPDLRHQVPDAQFFPEESVLEVTHEPFTPPDRHLSCAQALLRLCNAATIQEIGRHGPANAAGVTEANQDNPDLRLYEVFFPRDAHVVAYFVQERFPELTKATVLESLKYTGVRDNLRSPGLKDEQELGKIPHEIRDPVEDSIAQRLSQEKDWGWPYYGAVDTTVKNVKAISTIVASGDISFLEEMYSGLDGRQHSVLDGLQQNVNWIRKRMDFNTEGLVEALWLNPLHHANQTWADSPDAFHHANGAWAEHHPDSNWGVASVELQAEIYDALLGAAAVYEHLAPNVSRARQEFLKAESEDLHRRAAKLQSVVLEKFWVEDPEHYGGYFARGTDRDASGHLRPLEIRTSDMGHLLNSAILEGEESEIAVKREALIRNLFSPELLCPNGIRTLSSDSARFIKDRYHGGAAWPWVTYYIALGLGRHGYHGLAQELKQRVWRLYDATHILPEYGDGSDDPNDFVTNRAIKIHDPTILAEPIHRICQPPQEIQAWTAAAVYASKRDYGQRLFGRPGASPIVATNPQKQMLEKELLGSIKPA